MSAESEIRRYRRSDEAEAIGMLLEKLPPSERERAFGERLARWKWQYYNNPSNPEGEPLIWMALVDGVFAGMVATVPVKVRTPKGLVLGLWGVDFIVSRKMRGMGIGKKLLTEWLKTPGIAFVLGWSPVSFKVARGVGFEAMWGFTTADVLISRIGYALTQIRQKQRSNLNKLGKIFWKSNPRVGKPTDQPLAVERTLPEGAGELWTRVCESYAFCVERDETYLEWRFEAHPTHQYDFVSLGDPGRLEGLGICRLTDDNPPLGVVADLIVDPERKDLVSQLIDGAISLLRSRGAYAARMDLPPALADSILARYKCSLVKDRGMIVCTDHPGLKSEGIFEAANWYISRSDSDEDY